MTPRDSHHWCMDAKDIRAIREIGRGSFGIVRSATWHHTPVAIKILYQDCLAEDRELFEREVLLMATLHHPNIVQFFGYAKTPELTLVIEYFPEGSLETFVMTQKPSSKLCLSFCIDMALAIEYLHSRKPSIVIHRDIKPSNFLLTGSHRVKLGDFGIARARKYIQPSVDFSSNCSLDTLDYVPSINSIDTGIENQHRRISSPRAPTAEDLTSNCGTARFMAPEIAAADGSRTRKYSVKADIYSLALVYFFVWERILPSIEKHTTPALHLEAIVNGMRPQFHRMPKLMRDIISAMWQLDPDLRPTASSLLDYLTCLRAKPSLGSSNSIVLIKRPLFLPHFTTKKALTPPRTPDHAGPRSSRSLLAKKEASPSSKIDSDKEQKAPASPHQQSHLLFRRQTVGA